MKTNPDSAGVPSFTLEIPFGEAYVTVGRLVVTAVAGHLPFSLDEIEDLRIAVGEALNFYLRHKSAAFPSLVIRTTLHPNALEIRVSATGLYPRDEWDGRPVIGSRREVSTASILSKLVDEASLLQTERGSEILLRKKVLHVEDPLSA